MWWLSQSSHCDRQQSANLGMCTRRPSLRQRLRPRRWPMRAQRDLVLQISTEARPRRGVWMPRDWGVETEAMTEISWSSDALNIDGNNCCLVHNPLLQYKLSSSGLAPYHFDACKYNQAALFCTNCSFLMVPVGVLYRTFGAGYLTHFFIDLGQIWHTAVNLRYALSCHISWRSVYGIAPNASKFDQIFQLLQHPFTLPFLVRAKCVACDSEPNLPCKFYLDGALCHPEWWKNVR